MTATSKSDEMLDKTLSMIHHGRNVKYYRDEEKHMKQATLGEELTKILGKKYDQKTISLLEQQEVIEEEILNGIAKALDVDVEKLKTRAEDNKGVTIFGNTFEGESSLAAFTTQNYKCTFNPIDKIVELYERLLAAEKEKNNK